MKFVLSIFASLFMLNVALAQDDCTGLFPYEEGVVFDLSSFNKKGKLSSVATHEITSVESNGDELVATMESVVKDQKGKDLTQGSYTMSCKDGVFFIDVSALVNPGMTEAYANMDMKITGDGLQFPKDLEVGQDLPEGNTKMEVSTGGLGLMTLNMMVKDRKVEARENITTDAGTFDCYKVTHTFEMDMPFINQAYDVVEWYAPGVGMVRQENYRKGKMDSYTELTRFEKN